MNEASILPISFRLDILQNVMEGFNQKVMIGFSLPTNTIIYIHHIHTYLRFKASRITTTQNPIQFFRKMSEAISETPAIRVACEIIDCNKDYASKGGMIHHLKKHHRTTDRILSPLGSFLPSSSARVLSFSDEAELSTQGNSSGQVNSPKVRSYGRFACNICDNDYGSKEELNNHIDSTHTPKPRQELSQGTADQLNDEADVLELAKEDQDLYDERDFLIKNEIDQEKEGGDENIKKVKRLKNILKRKDDIQKETNETVKSLTIKIIAMKHEVDMSKEVEDRNRDQLDDLKNEFEEIVKVARTQRERNKDILITGKVKKRETDKLKSEKKVLLTELDSLRQTNSTLNKENSDLKIKLKAKGDLVTGLKEAFAVDNTNEVEVVDDTNEVEVVDSSVTMNKDTTGHKFQACNKSFRTSNDMENHMQAKHTEQTCLYCDQIFNNEQELAKHHRECKDMGVANSTCLKCNKKFTAPGLRRHQKTCHGANVDEDFDCPECGMMFDSVDGVQRHTDQEHKMEQAKSRVVCRHWRKGHCFKGDSCGFSHVGKQNHSESISTNKRSTRVPACSNGSSCEWLSRGSCSYFHPRVGVQKPWVRTLPQGRRQQSGAQGGRQQSGAQGGRQQSRAQGGRQQSGAQGGRQGGRPTITYLSLGRRLKKYGKNFRVLGENKVSLGYRLILAEFIITLGALKKLAMN